MRDLFEEELCHHRAQTWARMEHLGQADIEGLSNRSRLVETALQKAKDLVSEFKGVTSRLEITHNLKEKQEGLGSNLAWRHVTAMEVG